jgi:N6-adenosine-specific RNA methylase IME4
MPPEFTWRNPAPFANWWPRDLILADPPWRYDFSETGAREIGRKYNTSPVEVIISHRPKRRCGGSFLWATALKLGEAMDVWNAGASTKTHAIWDKEKVGMGHWFRGQHELLLVGTRGNFTSARVVRFRFNLQGVAHTRQAPCVYEWMNAFLTPRTRNAPANPPRLGRMGNEIYA